MVLFKLNHVLFFLFFLGYDCQRRIQGGIKVNETVHKNFVVYLLKAAVSPQNYDGWLCGGAIVSKNYIVTSAACVTDVKHLYAIAGYRKYTKNTNIYEDPCTKAMKKKIVLICTPKRYVLDYAMPAVWSNIDIALVKVESPYDFEDKNYLTHCSYFPGIVEINYDPKYQAPGIDAIVLGWGHTTIYRDQEDFTDLNQQMLKYASTMIEEKEECKKEYTDYPGMTDVIDNYMICTKEKGNLDDVGKPIGIVKPTADGCNSKIIVLQGEPSFENTDIPEDHVVLIENSRKDIKLTNFSRIDSDQKSVNSSLINQINKTVLPNTRRKEICQNENPDYADVSEENMGLKQNSRKDLKLTNFSRNNSDKKSNGTVSNSRRSTTRRNGICQNDHGGPLVTWVGGHQMLIGVASVFKVTEKRECTGPYLYTSTQCNGLFLDCIIKEAPPERNGRRTTDERNCSALLNQQGLELVETYISWKNHPDGPADNEKNGPTPVPAVNTDTNNGTTSVPAINTDTNNGTTSVPAINTDTNNGTTSVPAINTDTNNGTTSVPAINTDTNNGTTSVPAMNTDTNNGTTSVPAISTDTNNGTTSVPAINTDTNNGTTPVSAVNTVTNNGTTSIPAINTDTNNGTTSVPAINTDTNNGTTSVPAINTDTNNGTTSVPAINTDTNNGTTSVPAINTDTNNGTTSIPAINTDTNNGTTSIPAINTDTNNGTVNVTTLEYVQS